MDKHIFRPRYNNVFKVFTIERCDGFDFEKCAKNVTKLNERLKSK